MPFISDITVKLFGFILFHGFLHVQDLDLNSLGAKLNGPALNQTGNLEKLVQSHELFVNLILQCLACFELWCLGSRDRHSVTSLRIPTLSSSPLSNLESTKANQLYFAALYKFFCYCISESLNSLLCIFLGKFCLLSNCCD